MPRPHWPLLVTHSGTFHLDDAFAYAVLRLALGLSGAGEDHALVRRRDARARAAGALRRLPGAERELDGGRHAAGAGLLRAALAAAGGVGVAVTAPPRQRTAMALVGAASPRLHATASAP